MSSLFPDITLTETEEDIAVQCLSNPAVKKYLLKQAHMHAAAMIQGCPRPGETPEEYLRKLANVQGQLGVLQGFLLIQPAVSST